MNRLHLALPLLLCGMAHAQERPARQAAAHWVATWATAQQAVHAAAQIIVGCRALPTPAGPLAAVQAPGPGSSFDNQTVRMIARISLGGNRFRIELSSAVNSPTVAVGAAHIALRARGSDIVPGSDRALTFNGLPGCILRSGVATVSDPVDLDAPPLADLAVSLYFPGSTGPPTLHSLGLHTTYISKAGDFTAAPSIQDPASVQSYYYLSSIDVLAPAKSAAIVALGDSITDGSHSTPETDRAWPSVLAARLQGAKSGARLAVVNEGIGGNQVLRDGSGVSALERFDRDVLAEPGVAWVMVLEGINDIGSIARGGAPLTAQDLIGAMHQFIERAHMHGIKAAGCTLTPYQGAGYYSDAGEAIRTTLNDWIRNSGAFDAVVDFDAALRDPANPRRFRADMQSGDYLHPNDAGYAAMANAVDLALFTGKPEKPKKFKTK
ncbi:MAG TPA: SGNH/GDSL hydrolase family protein [Bryobacteraceae bacterium]|nr:SGNH/GDSL hydrolase family protein [Bryobacteraceae bacterium]